MKLAAVVAGHTDHLSDLRHLVLMGASCSPESWLTQGSVTKPMMLSPNAPLAGLPGHPKDRSLRVAAGGRVLNRDLAAVAEAQSALAGIQTHGKSPEQPRASAGIGPHVAAVVTRVGSRTVALEATWELS